MDKPVFSDEAYKLAMVAAQLCAGLFPTSEVESAVNWAISIIEKCDSRLQARREKSE